MKGFEGKKVTSSEILERKNTGRRGKGEEKEVIRNFWLRMKEKGVNCINILNASKQFVF